MFAFITGVVVGVSLTLTLTAAYPVQSKHLAASLMSLVRATVHQADAPTSPP